MTVTPLIGEIQFWANPFAMPDNQWLPCDGTSYQQLGKYSNLYLVIGTRFGGGNGTFKVPDLRHYAPMGAGHANGLSSHTIGQHGGASHVEQTIENMPSHSHTIDFKYPQGISMPASRQPATSASPIEDGYLATGTIKQGLTNAALNLYKDSPDPSSLVRLGALQGNVTGTLQPAGDDTPESRENRQPFITFGFYIAWFLG